MDDDHPRARVTALRAPGPRLYHKKSRNGCQRCRQRRVKCDENRPVCSSCDRHGVLCVYQDNFRHTLPRRHGSSPTQSHTNVSSPAFPLETTDSPSTNSPASHTEISNFAAVHFPEPPESTKRRLLEIRLLHNFVTQTCGTFSGAQNPNVRDIWAKSVPVLAVTHPALLNALLSVSALHLWRQLPAEQQLQDAYQTYYVLALQSHRSTIQDFEDAKDADATWFTSILIFVHAFAVLHDRAISSEDDRYEPPMTWLRVTHGARKVFEWTVHIVQDDPTTGAHAMINSIPALVATAAATNQIPMSAEFSRLLLPVNTDGSIADAEDEAELRDEEAREAYRNATAYLGLIQQSIQRSDHVQDICRWLIAFPVIVSSKMIALIEAKRPRALAILAYFFALAGSHDGAMEVIWWIGPIARREVEAIARSLPKGWKGAMSWPLGVVGTGSDG